MHIFTPTKTGLVFWAVHALIWGNLVFYVSVWLTTIFECVPQAKIWNPEKGDGHCINVNVAYAATGAVNVVSDLLILLLPMLAIWRLQMAPKRKLGVSAVFATGLMYVTIIQLPMFVVFQTKKYHYSAFASSICRLVYTTKFFASPDLTYVEAEVGMWT